MAMCVWQLVLTVNILQSRSCGRSGSRLLISQFVSFLSEGTLVWFDLMAIPADAPQSEAAHKFIDFILKKRHGRPLSRIMFSMQYQTPGSGNRFR